MRIILRMASALVLVLGVAALSGCQTTGSGTTAAGDYLFERNIAQFKDMQKVTSRDYKYLAAFDPNKSANATINELREAVIKAGTAGGFRFMKRDRGDQLRMADRRFLDTPNLDLYKKGYVIRESEDDRGLRVTIKELSVDTPERLLTSKFALAPGLERGRPGKLEEGISIGPDGKLHSYFELTLEPSVSGSALGQRTLGDYGKLVPELLNLGLPASTPLTVNLDAERSVERLRLRFGYFILPNGDAANLEVETWTRPNGELVTAEISFSTRDDKGYATNPRVLQASEDLLLALARAIPPMPDSADFMGSKVRVLLKQKK